MVNTVGLILLQVLSEAVGQLLGRGAVPTEGLLDDDTVPASPVGVGTRWVKGTLGVSKN